MKRIMYMMSLMLSLSVFVSCSNEDVISSTNPKEVNEFENYEAEFAKLKLQLDDLGYQTYGANYKQVHTRSLWAKLYKAVVSVVTADCSTGLAATAISGGNAVVGATVGILASAWTAFNQDKIADPQFGPRKIQENNLLDSNYIARRDSVLNDLIIPRLNGQPTNTLDSIGYVHNLVILSMYEDHPELFEAETLFSNEFADSVDSYVGKVLVLNSNLISEEVNSIPELVSMCHNIRQYILQAPSINVAMDSLQASLPEYYQEFDILNTFIESLNLEDDYETAEEYATAVFALIEESELPDNIKESLRAGLLIANASQKLWDSRIIMPRSRL